ncbi:glycerol-3-phosphate responsive antiterminator [Clostridium peptidivorans]|uniref:glycerol-3-phosphate responsive antiterminator n=1 Tax=Clostridium peptidivorans TaxID=100174 RepID=UPI000BE255A5|nr:glycerol-3-phosphate responsive antiterminator [Clostridium peptidivorans]
MKNDFYDRLSINPIIAAVKDLTTLEKAIKSPCEVIFLLTGNICNIKDIVSRVKAEDKKIYIHVDLMDGFARDSYALTYIKENIKPDGIITTKSNLIKIAKELGIFAIQRLFIIDNLSLKSGIHSINIVRPDAIEVMPGVMPKITKEIKRQVNVPIITGGLISDKEDVIGSINAGALGISTSKEYIWNM